MNHNQTLAPIAITPIPLVHRSQRRWSLVILGIGLVIVGVWLMLNAVQAAGQRVITCQPAEASAICNLQLLWLGVPLREASVTVQHAEADEAGRLRLLTDAEPLTVAIPAATTQNSASPVFQINALIAGESTTPITLQQGGDFQALPYGLAGSIMAAAGLILAIVAYRIVTRPTHANLIRDVAISPDGQLVASASWDRTVQLWRTSDHMLARALVGHMGAVATVAFTPNGEMLASAGSDHAVRLWRIADGALMRTLPNLSDAVNSLAISPDGQQVAAGSWDHAVRLWNIANGEIQHSFTAHTGTVEALAYSPDGQRLISASADCTVCVWHAADGSLAWSHEHAHPLTSVAISPDGHHIAAGSTDHGIHMWSTLNGQPIKTLEGHTGWVHDVAFMPDGQRLVSAGADKTIRLWDVDTGTLLHTFTVQTNEVTCIAVSSDGKTIVSGADQTVQTWVMPE